MALKLKYNDLGPLLFIGICVVIYAIPDSIQLPFRLLIFMGLIGTYLWTNSFKMPLWQILVVCISFFIVLSKIYIGVFDTSILMVFLSVIPIMNIEKYVSFSSKHILWLKGTVYILCFAIIAQLMFYRYEGRPNLSYEINQSGSYLFLFFLLSDFLKIKLGKFLVICSSLLLLSRLLVLAIIVFYIVRFINKYIGGILKWLTYTKLVLIANIFIILFSFVFLVVFAGEAVSGSNDASRLTNVVDGSNMLRFRINTQIVLDLLAGDHVLLYSGYGDMAIDPQYVAKYYLMPHNEILKSIAQFGFFVSLFFFFLSRKCISQYINRNTIVYFIPIVLYTLILWVRFTVVPSFEMIFILFLLNLKSNENSICHN